VKPPNLEQENTSVSALSQGKCLNDLENVRRIPTWDDPARSFALEVTFCRISLTTPFSGDTFCESFGSEVKRTSSGPSRGRKKMAPQGLVTPETFFIGRRAEQNGSEANSDHARRVSNQFPQQKNEFLNQNQNKLGQKCILEEVHCKHFPNVPLALPPCQLPIEIPGQADSKRDSVNVVSSRPTEARDFGRHATQRGCSFHSPELTVWTELCHVPPAQQSALAERNILF